MCGLSPRVRGNRRQVEAPIASVRVYPRVCGGTGCAMVFNSKVLGLSPRVRGNPIIA